MTTAVDVDLAASILCMWRMVREDLQEQQPRVGRIAEQVAQAFRAQGTAWRQVVREAAQHLAGDTAEEYALQLGDVVGGKAAAGLAAGMDLLLARGWNPEVAWQRALSGFGLDASRMRGLVAGVMPTPNASGAGVASDPLARTAVRTLLAYAETLARTEIKAWGNLHIAKAYDPREMRNPKGTPGGGRWAKVKEIPVDPLAGIGIAEETQAPVEPDRYARMGTDSRYAGLDSGSRYDSLTGNRYAGLEAAPEAEPQDRYAQLRDRYAALTPKQRRRREEHHYIVLRPIGEAPPEAAPYEAAPRGGHLAGHYVPLTETASYYGPHGGELYDGEVIDFTDIGEHLERHGLDPRITAHEYYSSFAAVEPPTELAAIRESVWDEAMEAATPLWEDVVKQPLEYATRLADFEIKAVAERAGFEAHKAELAIDQIRADVAQRRMHPMGFDGNLIEALADYVAWSRPELVREVAGIGDRPDGLALEQQADDAISSLGMIGIERLKNAPIPAVIDFQGGMHPEEKSHDLKGRYRVHRIEYKSAIGTYTAAGGSGVAPVGVIGLRQITTEPD